MSLKPLAFTATGFLLWPVAGLLTWLKQQLHREQAVTSVTAAAVNSCFIPGTAWGERDGKRFLWLIDKGRLAQLLGECTQ